MKHKTEITNIELVKMENIITTTKKLIFKEDQDFIFQNFWCKESKEQIEMNE